MAEASMKYNAKDKIFEVTGDEAFVRSCMEWLAINVKKDIEFEPITIPYPVYPAAPYIPTPWVTYPVGTWLNAETIEWPQSTTVDNPQSYGLVFENGFTQYYNENGSFVLDQGAKSWKI